MIKSKSIRWAESVASMGEMRKKKLCWKNWRKDAVGRSRHRWDNIRLELKRNNVSGL